MEAQHVAIDGSLVTVESQADLRAGPATTTGWAVVPSLMRTHPFTAYPAGHSKVMEQAVRNQFPDIEFSDEEEFSLKDGTLRIGEVAVPREGGAQRITLGAWEGRHGCLTTSLPAKQRRPLVETFETLQFRDTPRGLAIDSPVHPQPRPPEMIREIVGVGVMAIRPAVSTELERIPRAEGHRTRHGELFRMRADSRALVLLGRGSVARIQPHEKAHDEELAEAIEGLRVEWIPRRARPPRQ